MAHSTQTIQLQCLQTEVNSLVTTYNKLVALKEKFNAKDWQFPQSKITFDLNKLHDITDITASKYHVKRAEYNAMFFEVNGWVAL